MATSTWRDQSLSGDLMSYIQGNAAVDRVGRYFSEDKPLYTGRQFELLGGGGDRVETADRFTAEDLVAVSLLSVNIPGDAALEVLDPNAGLNEMLKEIPNGPTLWEATPAEVDDVESLAAELWRKLEHIKDVGWVTANKLLARKRPRLIPVYDRVVKAALQPDSKMFWIPLRNSLNENGAEAIKRLGEIKVGAGLDDRYSLLRVLDAAVWMTSRLKD